jgi:hypothetical protein
VNYQIAHEDFPQQSTCDQRFDEDQWEAYRRLGENMASEVFGALKPTSNHVSAGWQLVDLQRLGDDTRDAMTAELFARSG